LKTDTHWTDFTKLTCCGIFHNTNWRSRSSRYVYARRINFT